MPDNLSNRINKLINYYLQLKIKLRMGRIDKNGNMHGRFGNIVYYVRNGKQYGKEYNGKVNQPNTDIQQAQKEKMALCGKFTSNIKRIINIGYQASKYQNSVLEANSYHLMHAIKTVDLVEGDIITKVHQFDYTKAKVSRGLIDQPEFLAIEPLEHGIKLSWKPTLGSINTRFHDTLVAVFYTPGTKAYPVYNVGSRESGGGIIEYPKFIKGAMHLWVFWHNPNKCQEQSLEKISDSLYLGEFQI